MRKSFVFRNLLAGLVVTLSAAGVGTQGIARAGEAHQGSRGKLFLIEMAPELYYTAMRYDKFYGDPNSTHGNILERSSLLGNPSGFRDALINHGIYVDFGLTQFLQGNAAGWVPTFTRCRRPLINPGERPYITIPFDCGRRAMHDSRKCSYQ